LAHSRDILFLDARAQSLTFILIYAGLIMR